MGFQKGVPHSEQEKRRALQSKFENRYGQHWHEVMELYDERKRLAELKGPRQARASVFPKTEFLRLLAAQIENPDIDTKDFITLAKMYAEIKGWSRKQLEIKKIPDKLEEPTPEPKPEPILSEIELIQQIESKKREDNGTR